MRPITIVGAGQIGSMVAWRLLRSGKPVRVIDAGTVHDRPDQQSPWGWYRRISLQPDSKISRSPKLELPFHEANSTHGRMLITTRSDTTLNSWRNWITSRRSITDAYVMTPTVASQNFGLNRSFWQENNIDQGGVFVCDSRDFLIDFNSLNNHLWDYIRKHPNCEFMEDTSVQSIECNPNTNRATGLVVECGGEQRHYEIDQTLFCIGNKSIDVLPHMHPPILRVTLPYTTSIRPYYVKTNPILSWSSVWNSNSTLIRCKDGTVKLGCGTRSMISLQKLHYHMGGIRNALPFLGMAMRNNILFNSTIETQWDYSREKLLQEAASEINSLLNCNLTMDLTMDSTTLWNPDQCTVDLTPTLSPVVDYLPYAKNILLATGLSGSGSIALEEWFYEAIASSLEMNYIHPQLHTFRRLSIWENWFPHDIYTSPISSMGRQL